MARAPDSNSVAVLYFDNTSRDSAESYIADGLTDEIIVSLGRIPRLNVKSRNEVRRFRGMSDPRSPVLAQQLGVVYLVTGSVQRTASGLRVRAELVRASRGRTVWTGSFQHADTDLAAVTAAIADSVAHAVIGQLLPDERETLARRGTRSNAAYDLYLRGKAASRTYDYFSLHRAEGLFSEAVRVDPTFADAWAARADAWTWLADAVAPPRFAYPLARGFALRALALDSANASALTAEAAIRVFHDWSPADALPLAQHAVRIAPRLPEAHLLLGGSLGLLGDTAAAVAAIHRAFDLDSLNQRIAAGAVVFTYRLLDRLGEALDLARRVQAGPMSQLGSYLEAEILTAAGRCEEAKTVIALHVSAAAAAGYLCVRPGPESVTAVDSMVEVAISTWPYVRANDLGVRYVQAGDITKALPWLERAIAARDWQARWMMNNGQMQTALDDPRIQALIRRAEAATMRQP